jgi:hypothetical protein
LDLQGYRGYRTSKRFPDKAEVIVGDKVIKSCEVEGYFTAQYYWSLGVYIKVCEFGFPNSQSWGKELYEVVRIWEIFNSAKSEHESREIDKMKKPSKGVDFGNHRRTNSNNSRS